MEIIQLAGNEEMASIKAASALSAGGVILYPTDTLYGLGADAFSDEAVAKIYDIKGRDDHKPIHAIVSDLDMASEYGVISDLVFRLAEQLPKGKITFIVKKKTSLNTGIVSGMNTFGFRIPDNDLCVALTHTFQKPITATSANKSGRTPPNSATGVIEQLGGDITHIDLVIDAGELPASAASSVIDVSSGEIKILREGAIPSAEIFAALK